ncbi:MAG: hypothetical protein L0387_03945 [Acidobacteria bacterium]|nr:hypothetical protein [Acidobacteriota bacterium]
MDQKKSLDPDLQAKLEAMAPEKRELMWQAVMAVVEETVKLERAIKDGSIKPN